MGTRATLLGDARSRSLLDSDLEGTIRFGVVGLGHRSVGNVIRKSLRYDDYDLVAVCDLRPELVERVKADLERDHELKVRGYTDFDEMLKQEELDAVAVQIDPDKQAPLACQAMEAGLHVMCEVPSAGTMEAIRMCAKFEGMMTDPVYEGKSMHGMIDMVQRGEFPAGSRVLYAHLGGAPALSAYSFLFRNG